MHMLHVHVHVHVRVHVRMCMHKETPSHPLGRRTFMRRACLFGS